MVMGPSSVVDCQPTGKQTRILLAVTRGIFKRLGHRSTDLSGSDDGERMASSMSHANTAKVELAPSRHRRSISADWLRGSNKQADPPLTLLANSEAVVWTAMLGGKSHSEPRCLIGFRTSSGLIVDFANSITAGITWTPSRIDATLGNGNMSRLSRRKRYDRRGRSVRSQRGLTRGRFSRFLPKEPPARSSDDPVRFDQEGRDLREKIERVGLGYGCGG